MNTISVEKSCIKTTCAYCGVGCGVQAQVEDVDNHIVKIVGDTSHPANFGRLCSKGSALGDTVDLGDRLLTPRVDGREANWDYALDSVVSRLRAIIDQHGPESVALYGSGQLLTEDYYVANKLMKGFVGSSNIDTNSRLCMASTVAGHKRAFGEDIVPGCYEDLEQAELIVLVGSNTAWCHPVIYQRLQASREESSAKKLIVIDPRKTATCEGADLHLPLKPGTDTVLFAGLLVWLADNGGIDNHWLQAHTENFEQSLDNARELASSLDSVAETCGLNLEDLRTFYSWFLKTEKTVTAWSQGANQGFDGTDRVNAMINVHLATGRIGKPGCGPFSLTGQPNAMGGREVGGLANQLAAHMDFSNPDDIDRVQRFWDAPNMVGQPGLTAVDMFEAMERGEIRFVWIMGTNPAVSMPDAGKVRAALEKCEHVVVSDCLQNTDTSAYADILLPAAPWSEKDGTVTNSERRISRQRALFPLAGESKPDWWILSQVGKRLGFDQAFDYDCNADVFREHARLSAFENSREQSFRAFNLSGLVPVTNEQYESFAPQIWPILDSLESDEQRFFAQGNFSTPSGKAKFIVPDKVAGITLDSEFPLLLNTGRIRDQWHTMTRTARAVRLNRHISEPFVQVNPIDADDFKLLDGELVEVLSSNGRAIARVQVDSGIVAGQLFMPMHWTREFSRGGLVGPLVHNRTDPVSRQPDSKATPVRVSPYKASWYGVLISRRPFELPEVDYCAAVRSEGCWRYELSHGDGQDVVHQLLPEGDVISLMSRAGMQRQAVVVDGCIEVLLLFSDKPLDIDRQWLEQQFQGVKVGWKVLAGSAGSGKSQGPVVCACFGVSEAAICKGIEQGWDSVETIGQKLNAGTNCGSCIPELKRYLLECKNKLELAV
ncbi:nitrate reductase [Parendozoicomonas sp. Alg238-R29]|uniref:nitrate reductase n=1 Tax=Parendozoicomonas sp. Alg238-R29 TaxID=2993446 RepID=UPI00248F06C8|nr:nitrate reductase [Parendozoicomonas sp. Alg238-R29]